MSHTPYSVLPSGSEHAFGTEGTVPNSRPHNASQGDDSPAGSREAIAPVREWLERPFVQIIEPGSRPLDIFESLLAEVGAGGNLTTDAHLAALAIEHQCELHSNDTDLARFSGLRCRNPLF